MVAALRGGAAKVSAVKASRLFVSPRRLIGILCVPILAFLLHALLVAVKTSRRPTSTAAHDLPQHFYPASPPFWHRLGQLVALAGDDADGAAASHSVEARQEAARALVGNYQQVVNDCCGSGPPPSQPELVRLPHSMQSYADEAVREAVRRLLGRREGVHELQESKHPSSPEQAAAWAQTAKYLSARVQAAAEEVPGRTPDMSAAAAAAARAVLGEMGPANPPLWHRLEQLAAEPVGQANGAAASHSAEARQEAARALVGNYQRVVNDCCGSEPPPTQQALVRVPKALQCYADEALRETVRRLLGWRDGVKELVETLEPSSAEQAAAWSAVGTYLSARVQAAAEEVPGRAPDMSAAAAAAMRAVLAEVCAARAEPEATAEQPNPTASAPAPRASAPAPRAP